MNSFILFVFSWIVVLRLALNMSDSSGVMDEETNKPVTGPRRSTHPRTCPGCSVDHREHFWGPPHRDCQGRPSMPLPGEQDQQVGVLKSCDSLLDPAAVINAGTAIDFDFDEFGVTHPVLSGNVNSAGLNTFKKPISHDVHDSDEEQEQFLHTCLEQLQLEKHALQRKKRIIELRQLIEREEKQLDVLKRQAEVYDDEEHQHVKFDPSVNFRPLLTTKSLKKMTKSVDIMPLDSLLGTAGTQQGFLQYSVNLGLSSENQTDQSGLKTVGHASESLHADITRPNASSCTDLRTQANLLLQPKARTCKYYKIVDFVHNTVQDQNEKVLGSLADGTAKLCINYGNVKPRVDMVSIPQYVIGSIQDIADLQQYFAYIIKTMELAMRFECMHLSMTMSFVKTRHCMVSLGYMRATMCMTLDFFL